MKKLICLFISFSFIFVFSLSAFASSTNEPYYNDYGYLTYQTNDFISSNNYSEILGFNPSLLHSDSTSIPAGFIQVAYLIYSGPVYNQISAIYGNPDWDYSLSLYSNSLSFFPAVSGNKLYMVTNRVNSSGDLSFLSNSSQHSFGGSYSRISCLVPVSLNGSVILPEAQVNFTMNTAIIGFNLSVNSQINSGDAFSVDYYIFPSTTPISSGSTSTIVPFTPASELTDTQQENFLLRGFKILTYGFDDLITDIASPKVSLSVSSSVRSSSLFDPSSYGVSFEKIGSGRLYPSSGGGGITPTASLSLKDMISSHTGVYASSTLKLVGVVNTTSTSFVSTFDFAPASIVGSSPVAPSTISGAAPYPDFSNSESEFSELANYLKNLFSINNDNQKRNDSNFIAMLGAMPWADYIGTGFGSQLPQLSMYLDSLFQDLFSNLVNDFSSPSQEDIDTLYAQIQAEKNDLKSKLAFVTDVKTEVYFIISTITADNNSVPPNFEVTLPSVLFGGGSSVKVNILSYELATPYIVGIIKDIITVFLSLSLVVYIWKTLPSTIGNMPRGDD